jgi:iron complex outermembrane receptor protein
MMKLNLDTTLKWLLVLVAVGTWNFAVAQTTISGTVTDAENGDPLIGANILVVGTSSGAITDLDGNYSITVPDGATQIEFSYTGYTSQIVDVPAGGGQLNVQLEQGTQLDEVVVTGYGTAKAKEVTGSITSVKAEDFNQGNVNDVNQLLQGKVAGLVISRPGADPNGGFNVRLRGLSSVGANNSPLVVIDGVLGGDLNSVEPQDIASIDILQDGSAAAIYGTRGAAGVIVVTTKRGKAGTSQVDYTGQVTFETPARILDVLTAEEYRNWPVQGTDLGGNIDWYDELMQTGFSNIHNLSLSGGNAQTSYRISGNYRDVEGIARETGFSRLNFRGNLTTRALNDRLTIQTNLAASTSDQNLGFTEAFRYATVFNPTTPFIRDENNPDFTQFGGYYQQQLFDYFNPVAMIEQNTRENERKTVAFNIRGDYALTDNLTAGLFYSTQRANTIFGEYISKFSFSQGGINRNGLAQRRNDESQDQLFRFELNYNNEFSNGVNFGFLAGYEYQDFTFQGFGAQGGNFLTDAFTFNNLGSAQDFANGLGNVFSYKNTNVLVSFFGRATLNVNDTYFMTASLRRDGSSRFGADNKWGLFPAVSAGVDLVNAVGISGFDQLKFRAGYGVTGNNVNQSLLSLQRFGPQGNFFFNGAFTPSFGPISNPNPNLKWETKTDFNVGFDFALLDYKLTGSIEYYNSTTEDGIFNFNVPVPPNLFPTTFFNVGEINNSGVELTLSYLVDLPNDNSWTVAFTGSRWFDPTLVSLTDDATGVSLGGVRDIGNLGSPGQNGTPLGRLEEGAPLGQLWGLVINPDNPVAEDGTWNFVDVDGNGVQDDLLDRAVIGTGFPKYNLGLNNTFALGNFDVNIFFRGVLGHDLVNTFRAFYEAPGQISAYNVLASSRDIANLVDQPQFSSRHVESGDFVSLEQMTIGYTFNQSALPNAFRKIRVFFTGQNLWMITGYQGVSPEPRLADGSNSLLPGIARRNEYFTATGFTFGVNLGF